MKNNFGVGLGLEDRAFFLQRLAQLAKVFDDSVMDDGDAFGGVRMGVVFGRLAVGRPARMADSGMAFERSVLQSGFEIFELAFGTAAFEAIAFQRRDASGIITAIFETFERVHQLLGDRSTPENADNAAHAVC